MSEYLNENELSEAAGGAQKAPYTIYFVQSGDSLGIIAQNHGCTLEELCRLNGITKDTMIHPNDQLIVPNI